MDGTACQPDQRHSELWAVNPQPVQPSHCQTLETRASFTFTDSEMRPDTRDHKTRDGTQGGVYQGPRVWWMRPRAVSVKYIYI